MAITVATDVPRAYRIGKNSPTAILTGTLTLDASYATGGYSLTGVSRYFRTIKEVNFEGSSTGGYAYRYDLTNNKVLVHYPQGGSASGTNDGSGTTKTGAVAVTADAATASVNTAPGKEVQNAKDLSAVTDLRFIAVGLL